MLICGNMLGKANQWKLPSRGGHYSNKMTRNTRAFLFTAILPVQAFLLLISLSYFELVLSARLLAINVDAAVPHAYGRNINPLH